MKRHEWIYTVLMHAATTLPDDLEIAMVRAIAFQALDDARQCRPFHGCFHGFVVDSSSWRVRRHGRPARLTKVVVRLDGYVLDQQTLVEAL